MDRQGRERCETESCTRGYWGSRRRGGWRGSLIEVTISNIRNRSTNSLNGRTLRWVNVPVSGNTFGGTVSRSNYLRGKFYGPNTEEAGAVFEQQGITGSFSTKR